MKHRWLGLSALGVIVIALGSWYIWSQDAWWQSVKPDIFSPSARQTDTRGAPSESVVNFLTHSTLTDLQIIDTGSATVFVTGLAGSDGAPPAPQGLVIKDLQTGDSLRLTWNLPVDASRTAVEVWRGGDSASLALFASLPPTAELFTDSSLKTGQVYWYALTARAGETVSAKSPAVSGNPTDTMAPSPPRELALSRLASGSGFHLSWTRAEISESVTYRVWRSEKPEERGVMLAASVDGLIYDDATAVSGTTYWYRVTAVDSAGNESVALPAGGKPGRSPLLGSPPLPAKL